MTHLTEHPAARTSRRPGARRLAVTSRRAFSIPELIVVVGTVLVLVAILFPVIGSVRESARAVQCASNLRQIGQALTNWRVQNDPKQMAPATWRLELGRFASGPDGRRIFYCPEQGALPPGMFIMPPSPPPPPGPLNDGTWQLPGGAPTAGGGPADGGGGGDPTPQPAPPGPLLLYMRDANTVIELRPGPWVQRQATPTGYRLSVEDSISSTSDLDFNDVVLDFAVNPDGSQSVTVAGTDRGNMPYDLLDANGKLLVSNFAPSDNSGTGSTFGPFLVPPDQPDGADPAAGGGGSSGSGGTPDASGGVGVTSAAGLINDPRLGLLDSDYAINIRADKVWGNADKILFLDYVQTIIADAALDATLWTVPGRNVPPFARHVRQLNVLYGDGSVRRMNASAVDLRDADKVKTLWEP